MSIAKGLLFSALALLLCFGVAYAANVDLAVNGGFETGDFTGWAQFPSGPDQQTIITPGSEGDYAACVENSVIASASVLKNNNLAAGLLPAGVTVTITFDARGAGAVGGVAFAELFSEIDGGGVSKSELLGGTPLALDPDPAVWKSFSFTTTAGPDVSGGLTVQFAVVTGADPASTMTLCVDNLQVLVDGSVPADEASVGHLKGSYR